MYSFAARHKRFFKLKECLAENDQAFCSGQVVRAHIVSRSQLSQIARNGHVLAVPNETIAVMKMHRTGFEATEVGIGDFSTLNCFCAAHDKRLFAPVEDVPLTFSPEQLALLHYRAMIAEFYQRRSQSDSALSELEEDFDDPRKFRFAWIFEASLDAIDHLNRPLNRMRQLLASRNFGAVASLIVRFDNPPAVMAAGVFRPHYDFAARRVQKMIDRCSYVGMHLLSAEGQAAMAFTWLRRDTVAEGFVRTFASRPHEQLASLAVQCAFEHIEHTCMSHTWWHGLRQPMKAALLECVRRANSLSYRRSPRCLSYRLHYASWPVVTLNFF
ncbi:hypothetical protein [Bradyrhizobium arachidis]|nr:hypothetical protein [Bradyrhizobium arachidis]